MTAFQSLPAIPHLEPIFAAIAAANPHDGQARADSIDPRRSLALLAPAGSGKTTQLLFRMLACLTVVERPEEILAITFTTKAAGEILERVTSAPGPGCRRSGTGPSSREAVVPSRPPGSRT
ncbi:UvrD-helicase domain-containing protein (plasmid) [Pseudomonas aeruginosa]|nr:UvrD-helicase domain-containing protein [Pseudomonas aeruginosa]